MESARKADEDQAHRAEDSISKGTNVRNARMCARKPQAAADSDTRRAKQRPEERGAGGTAGAGFEPFTHSFI